MTLATSRLVLIKRILWPARASLFALIGGAVGLFGDLVSFFAEFLSAGMLVLIFAGITAAAALLCLQRAFMVNEGDPAAVEEVRSEEHTSELQSLMRISYACFCLKKK